MQMLRIIREIISTPALLVGLIVLAGLVLQKKPADHVIKGTVTAVVGFAMLSGGSDLLRNGALKDFGELFRYDFHIQGVIPNMEAVSSLGIQEYATLVSEIMILGMALNLIMAKFGPFHYIFLTGHHTLYMASLLAVVLTANHMPQWQILIAGSLILGFLMAAIPAMIQKEMEKVTGNDRIALGHFSAVGYLLAAKIGMAVGNRASGKQQACMQGTLTEKKCQTEVQGTFAGKKRQTEMQEILARANDKQETVKNPEGGDEHKNIKRKSAEDVHFPAKLSFMRDSTVGIFLVMTVIFLMLAGIAARRTDLAALDLSYGSAGYQNWIIYAIMEGAQFSVAIYVILAGVRLIIAEIVPAFKGIAAKLVPYARPAVDCPILFSYAPNAAMIGFLMSFAGGIVTMLVLIGFNMIQENVLLPIIVPGVVAHFFCGGSAGVFANAEGGLKGCLTGAFVHGIFISLLSLAVMPVIGTLNLSGTAFSDSDFCIAGIVVGNLGRVFSGYGILILGILCFGLPIIWEQMRQRRRK